jgi:hypothetical protein
VKSSGKTEGIFLFWFDLRWKNVFVVGDFWGFFESAEWGI